MYGALLTAAAGACWSSAREEELPRILGDVSRCLCGAERDDFYLAIWTCPEIDSLPSDATQKNPEMCTAGRGSEECRCFWTRGMLPTAWMEVLVACDEVDACVVHSSTGHSADWAKENCLMFTFDETVDPFPSDPVLGLCGFRGGGAGLV